MNLDKNRQHHQGEQTPRAKIKSTRFDEYVEFEENMPRRVHPFISNEPLMFELDEFLSPKNTSLKVFVLLNAVLEQRKFGLGKKTAVAEFCYLAKIKSRVNIRWLDASSPEIFDNELDSFALKLRAYEPLSLSKSELLFARLDSLPGPTLFVVKNLQSWEILAAFLARLVESAKCKLIVISRTNLKRNPNKAIRFVEYNFRPSLAECESYLNFHLGFKLKSNQINQLLDFLSGKYQHIINPFELEKLTHYLKYNYLYSPESILKQLMQIDGFRLSQIVQFVKKVDSQAYEILQLARYLYADFVPIDLLLAFMLKKKFEIQNSVKFLLDLNLIDLVGEQQAATHGAAATADVHKGLTVSRLVVMQLRPAADEEFIMGLEKKLLDCLLQHFEPGTSQMVFYPSVISFLDATFLFSPTLERNLEFARKYAELCYMAADFNCSYARFNTAIKLIELGLDRMSRAAAEAQSQQKKSATQGRVSASSSSLIVPEKFNSLLGICYFQQQNYDKALDCLVPMHSNGNVSAMEARNGVPRPHFVIGKCYFETGNFSDASKHLKRAFETSGQEEESIRYECARMLAMSSQRMQKYASACKYSLYMADMVKANPRMYKTTELIEIYTRVAHSLSLLDDWSRSLGFYELAFDIASKTSDFNRISWLFVKMGRVNLELKNFDQAFSDFRSAFELRETKPASFSLAEMAEPLDWMGVCHRRRKAFPLALGYFEKAFRLRNRFYQGSSNNFDMVKSLVHLGLVSADLGDHVKSEEFLNKAYEIKRELLKGAIDEDKLARVERWSKHVAQEHVLADRSPCGSVNLKQHLYDCDGRQMARAYLFGRDDVEYVRVFLGKESELTRRDCDEFVRWFESSWLSS